MDTEQKVKDMFDSVSNILTVNHYDYYDDNVNMSYNNKQLKALLIIMAQKIDKLEKINHALLHETIVSGPLADRGKSTTL